MRRKIYKQQISVLSSQFSVPALRNQKTFGCVALVVVVALLLLYVRRFCFPS